MKPISLLVLFFCLFNVPFAKASSEALTGAPLNVRNSSRPYPTPLIADPNPNNADLKIPFVDISELNKSNIHVHLIYGTNKNFLGKDLYGPLGLYKAYIHPDCAGLLADAADRLKKKRPDLMLEVYDATRPNQVQAQMRAWADKQVADGKMSAVDASNYVGHPGKAETQFQSSMHVLGLAVDVSLAPNPKVSVHRRGKAMKLDAYGGLPMGTKFDEFSPCVRFSPSAADCHKLPTSEEMANRQLLHDIMTNASTAGGSGFVPYANEWWHFNCMSREDLKAAGEKNRLKYPIAN